jgi:hypothetical protein
MARFKRGTMLSIRGRGKVKKPEQLAGDAASEREPVTERTARSAYCFVAGGLIS